jgi:hypothetical protein
MILLVWEFCPCKQWKSKHNGVSKLVSISVVFSALFLKGAIGPGYDLRVRSPIDYHFREPAFDIVGNDDVSVSEENMLIEGARR